MRQYGVSNHSLINNAGILPPEESDISSSSFLFSSATTFVNHGLLEATTNSSLSLSGDVLNNWAGSQISASGSGARVLLDIDEMKHSDRVQLANGGGTIQSFGTGFDGPMLQIGDHEAPRSAWIPDPSTWLAGLGGFVGIGCFDFNM